MRIDALTDGTGGTGWDRVDIVTLFRSRQPDPHVGPVGPERLAVPLVPAKPSRSGPGNTLISMDGPGGPGGPASEQADLRDSTPTRHAWESDATELLDFLRSHGPHSYGAAASALGWGATRAWQAEARLRAAGMVRHDDLGRALLKRPVGR